FVVKIRVFFMVLLRGFVYLDVTFWAEGLNNFCELLGVEISYPDVLYAAVWADGDRSRHIWDEIAEPQIHIGHHYHFIRDTRFSDAPHRLYQILHREGNERDIAGSEKLPVHL